MKQFTIAVVAIVLMPSSMWASDVWGPEIIKFDLEGGTKDQIMHWISGYSYSTTEFLRVSGCLESKEFIASKELITAINEIMAGKSITSESAAKIISNYVQNNYPCTAYNQ